MAKESTFKNMLLCLLIVCFGGSAILGGVYVLTYKPIEASRIAKEQNAIKAVVPEFDNNPVEQMFTQSFNGKDYKVYPATKAGESVGCAIQASTTKGFGGKIVLMVGFNADGSFNNIQVLSHSETPGLGDNINPAKSDFIASQFPGKNPEQFRLNVKKDGGDVDAITAATITSRAFCDALTQAYGVFKEIAANKQ